ncbi:MAG: beta-L-arabinofuranosidase domain-containing protein, partial [Actinomycetota bacterium]
MKKLIQIESLLIILALSFSTISAQFSQNAIKPKAAAFRLNQVQLLESPFKRAMLLDADVLLKIKPDRLLHNFLKNAGLEPKDKIYGGWESREIAGHTLGHYLSAISMHYASTGDKRFLERANYIVDELEKCQKRDADGYVSGIPDGKRIFNKLAQGNIVVTGPHNFDEGWVPWYTMHKLFEGLLSANEFTGNKKALKIVTKLADWADRSTQNLSDEQIQKILSVEHGGMLEALVDLAERTGDKKYLKLSERFYHKAVLDPLAAGQVSILQGLHANTQVPKILGAARLFEISGDPKDEKIAENFWDEVVNHYTYVNGGNSDRERFGKRDELAKRMSGSMTETCNTYNMLKLTRHLFEWNPQATLFDYYERALYNQILASQDPKTGLGGYKLGLYGGYF